MPRPSPSLQLIEFKGTSLQVVAVTLRSLHPQEVAKAANTLFGDDPFFDGDAALLELAHLGDLAKADWPRLHQVLKRYGLNVMGVRGGSAALRLSAAAVGLPTYPETQRPPRAAPPEPEPAPAPEPPVAAPPPLPVGGQAPTQFIDRPLRSGQQFYARGGDLVVLAAVNAGAEVIADGSIHIYAPLRGRALAGASGAENARIFCTRFDAELVSVAGLYRTFESGVARELADHPVQVRLNDQNGGNAGKLIVEALKTD